MQLRTGKACPCRFCRILSMKYDKEWCYAFPMDRKGTTNKIKKLVFPLAFVLLVVLSAVYKLVLKGNGDFSIQAFKSGRKVQLSESTEDNEASATTAVEASYTSALETSQTVQLISIYICGEVNKPGIYEALPGVLLNDIVEDAGGFTEEASVNNINLVYQITGNMSIYIPSTAEIEAGYGGSDIIRADGVFVWGEASASSSDAGSKNALMVNINTATVYELKNLPGIGEVTAQAIVDYRENTPFTSIEDIKNVSGIGDAKYDRIKNYICV